MSMEIIYLLGGLAAGGLAAFFLSRRNSASAVEATTQLLLLQQEMQKQMDQSMSRMREELARSLQDSGTAVRSELQGFSQQLNERMKETTSTLQGTQASVGQRLDSAARVIGELQNRLGALDENSKRILDVGQGLRELKDILQSPKLRGNMGEYFLEEALKQILPNGTYKMQYPFKSGEVVDAVVKVGDSLICVDSKFPIESFKRLIAIPDDQVDLKNRESKAFRTVIKKHADAIAKKYILPEENTFDFAFMYIPAENVYYETIIREDLSDGEASLYTWLLDKRVIPVSPNSLYAYLQVIVLGLKGMRIQESAKQILQGLGQLSGDLGRFKDDFGVLGKHLRNATNTFDNANKRLEKYEDRYALISQGNQNIAALTETKISSTPEISQGTLL